jgi:hypothetical protein
MPRGLLLNGASGLLKIAFPGRQIIARAGSIA